MAEQMRDDLTAPERAAMDAWLRVSADTTGMLYAVRAAIAQMERSEDARLSIAERKNKELTAELAAAGRCNHTDGPHRSIRDCREADQRIKQALNDETVVLNDTIRSLREDLSAAKKQLRGVSMVKCWTNEDGRRFVFVTDLQDALGVPRDSQEGHRG